MSQELKIKKNGFTLIELLIVVAIISILAALLMANFIAVRQRARDAQRKADLRQMQSAAEMYRSDYGSYPTAIPNCSPSNCSQQGCSPPSLMDASCTKQTYMARVPQDPAGSGYWNGGYYWYTSNGSTYTLGACLENTNDGDPHDTTTNPDLNEGNCPTKFYFVLTNP
ncbi:prepilin-type N-terminal cleavage/methylation domain-containing protein [Patescibacteria group bacterium]|nr:prepilin-type N-terminal cleavage/methylation domain-containing protein [Patescibacteria group bacterium]MCL5010326.1 prepilin-type N-terminal cleavage/methylation domain-containing protein [Patescibacteria group bacterium]